MSKYYFSIYSFLRNSEIRNQTVKIGTGKMFFKPYWSFDYKWANVIKGRNDLIGI